MEEITIQVQYIARFSKEDFDRALDYARGMAYDCKAPFGVKYSNVEAVQRMLIAEGTMGCYEQARAHDVRYARENIEWQCDESYVE